MARLWQGLLVVAALMGMLGAAARFWHGDPIDTRAPHLAALENAQIFVGAALGARPEFLPEYLTTETGPEQFTVSGLFRDPERNYALKRYEIGVQHLGNGAWERLWLDVSPLR
jgi:hypothetical protein